MSDFAALFDSAAFTLDGIFGDTVVITPMAGGKVSRARPDPSRPVREVVGVYVAAPDDARLFDGRREGRSAIGPTEMQVVRYTVELRPETTRGLGYRIAVGDRITLPGHAEPNDFVVVDPNPDDLGGIVLGLALWGDSE